MEARALSDTEPILTFRPRGHRPADALTASLPSHADPNAREAARPAPPTVRFSRQELSEILAVYGRKVASGEWRDYAMDFGREKAVFSVFRRASECPLVRIEKNPKLASKQGAYSVIAASGLILKRGAELARVLTVLEKRVDVVR